MRIVPYRFLTMKVQFDLTALVEMAENSSVTSCKQVS